MVEPEVLHEGRVLLYGGECLSVVRALGANTADAVVTDPPYHLTANKNGGSGPASLNERSPAGRARVTTGFMGKAWDGGDIAFRVDLWAELLRVLRPGGYVLAFGGTRTYHRMACAIEDAGFTIRDQLAWVYGSGFPKSLNVSKAIDETLGAKRTKVRVDAAKVRNPKATGGGRDGMEGGSRPWIERALEVGYHEKDGDEPVTDIARQWDGWGTALKPAWEPIVLAQKPLLDDNVAKNVLRWGNGALNVDGCRVPIVDAADAIDYALNCSGDHGHSANRNRQMDFHMGGGHASARGRWPANIVHDGSDEVIAAFPADTKTTTAGPSVQRLKRNADKFRNTYGAFAGCDELVTLYGDSGSAARFFYCAKASKSERDGSKHPTVKPLALMRWLVRLVTPPNGLVIDCFAGSGTTGEAALCEGVRAVLVEREAEYLADIRQRIAFAFDEKKPILAPHAKRRTTKPARRQAAGLEKSSDD
jgi:DNA modification methylase